MCKLNTFILTVFCAFTNYVRAQNIQFDRMYDDYGGWEIILQEAEVQDSFTLLTCQTEDLFAADSTFNRRLYFNLLDNKGNKKNGHVFSYEDQEFIYAQPIIKKGNEYFMIASYNNLDSALNGKGKYAKGIYVDVNTADTLRTFNIKYHYIPNSKPSFSHPTLAFNGTFLNYALYNGKYQDSIYLFWSDSLGNVIRVKEYPQLHMLVSKIIETPDRGFLLAGKEFHNGVYVPNANSELIWVGHPERLWYAKIDSIGNLLWQKLLTGPGYELYDTIWFKHKVNNETNFRDATITEDGNYVLAGFIENNPYLRKIKENGDLIWERKYFNKMNYLDSLKRRALFIDIIEEKGHLYVLGYKDTLFINEQLKQSIPFLMKLNSSGGEVWTRYFITGASNYLYNVFACKGGFFLTGSKHDTIPKYGSMDAWLIRVDINGCLIPGCELRDGIEPAPFPQNMGVLIYPNPTNTTLTIQSKQPYSSIELYNTTGNLVLKETNTPETMSVSALPQGLYILRILGPQQEVVATVKVSVVH
ncbi:MAG: T9SS type A sorting domain-containing protein [Bacteroidota bacterium]